MTASRTRKSATAVRTLISAVLLPILVSCTFNDTQPGEISDASTRKSVVALMLQEVEDHRYQQCSAGSTCNEHLAEYARQIAIIDARWAQQNPDASVWREGIDGLVDPGEQPDGTLQQYIGDDRREALYRQLVEDRLADAEPGQSRPVAILTMGAPGSGKSSALRTLGLCQDDVVMVDPDSFKLDLVEYQAARAAHDRLAADRVHRESSMLAKLLRDKALLSSRDVCIDGVLSRKKAATELIQRLQSNGYEVTIVAAVVPFDVSYARVESRGEQTGRFVPYEFARQAFDNIEGHRDELLRIADRGYSIDTSGDVRTEPTLIAHFEDGIRVSHEND